MAAPRPNSKNLILHAAPRKAARMRMEAGRARSGQEAEDQGREGWIVESGRIGKQAWTTWNCERTWETARWSAREALPQTPPGGKPPETLAPFPCDRMVGAVRDLSRVRRPLQNRAPLTDRSRP